MAKVIALLLLGAMIVHLIRPLGLPGLRKRGDFWKIALVALVVMMLTVLIRPQ
ncbi:MAG: hypothetical protein MEQ84_05640 [Mesorhizobium sp.]|nr:hypothetical protein [Mesorhizobium sp.]